MREKLRNFYRGKSAKSQDHVIKSFTREAQQLISEGGELPYPFEFYLALLNSAFKFISEDESRTTMLNDEYITF